MKKYKSFLLKLNIFILINLLIVMSINIHIDNFAILRKDLSKQIVEPNQNYFKMNYILNNKTKYDSFIFGSSRVGKIIPNKIKDGKYYNMSYPEGIPQEHLRNIKYLLNNGVYIKNLWIGLDDFSYKLDPSEHFNNLLKMPYPITIQEKLNFYASQFIKKPNKLGKKHIIYNLEYDFYNSGRIICRECHNEIENNPQKHLKTKFNTGITYDENYFEDSITAMKQITELCRKNHINLKVFINPINHITYKRVDIRKFNKFKKELSDIVEYWDFSGLNHITTDNIMYYETSHYREKVGNQIINVIENNNSKNVEGFGFYVTKSNIDKHIKRLSDNINK